MRSAHLARTSSRLAQVAHAMHFQTHAAAIRTLLVANLLVVFTATTAHATTAPTVPVPEPGMLTIVGSGLAAAVLYARNRRR